MNNSNTKELTKLPRGTLFNVEQFNEHFDTPPTWRHLGTADCTLESKVNQFRIVGSDKSTPQVINKTKLSLIIQAIQKETKTVVSFNLTELSKHLGIYATPEQLMKSVLRYHPDVIMDVNDNVFVFPKDMDLDVTKPIVVMKVAFFNYQARSLTRQTKIGYRLYDYAFFTENTFEYTI